MFVLLYVLVILPGFLSARQQLVRAAPRGTVGGWGGIASLLSQTVAGEIV